jgi:hypothetical protein
MYNHLLKIGRGLESLPNSVGFRFRGVTHNGDLLPCVVKQDEAGMHCVEDEDTGECVFTQLRGWLNYLSA